MKFLLEFVSCCGPCSRSGKVEEEEETRPLVPDVPRWRGRKRVRLVGVRGSNGGEWRPTLSSISEDDIVGERVDNEQERNLKRKKSSNPKARPHNYHENVRRRASPSLIIPVLSPAPFMF